jgi:hypothetical protein
MQIDVRRGAIVFTLLWFAAASYFTRKVIELDIHYLTHKDQYTIAREQQKQYDALSLDISVLENIVAQKYDKPRSRLGQLSDTSLPPEEASARNELDEKRQELNAMRRPDGLFEPEFGKLLAFFISPPVVLIGAFLLAKKYAPRVTGSVRRTAACFEFGLPTNSVHLSGIQKAICLIFAVPLISEGTSFLISDQSTDVGNLVGILAISIGGVFLIMSAQGIQKKSPLPPELDHHPRPPI